MKRRTVKTSCVPFFAFNTAKSVNKARSRWFQFRLRTLLIAVMLLAVPCAYVAHEASIVRERKAILADVESKGGSYWGPPANSKVADVSWIRRMLGDVPLDIMIIFPHRPNLSELRNIKSMFPEAYLSRLSEGGDIDGSKHLVPLDDT